jgi:GxxExxY protein
MKPDPSSGRDATMRVKLVEEATTREIIGAFYEVYNTLGFGFIESIYKRALEIALAKRGLTVEREFPVEIYFDGKQVGLHRIDMLVARRVIVEVKATHALVYADKLQLMNYVTAMNFEVGLLLHFGPRPEFKRVLGGWKPEKSSTHAPD